MSGPPGAGEDGLRLRMKVWTDPSTKLRYLVAVGVMPHESSTTMSAYAMRDDQTRLLRLTVAEWNRLPFYYFVEDGEAPRKEQTWPAEVVS